MNDTNMSLDSDDLDIIDLKAIIKSEPDVEPSGPTANVDTLRKQATKIVEQTEKTKKAISKKMEMLPGIDRIMEILDHDDEIRNKGEPPSWEEVRSDENYCSILDELQNIVKTYMKGNFDFAQSQMDIIRMSSFLIYLSEQLSVFQAQSAEARTRLEDYRTKVYIKIKKSAQQEGARVTDTDAKELARYYSIDISQQVANLEFVEKYLFNAFHSIRTFQEMLNYVASRDLKIKKGPGMY